MQTELESRRRLLAHALHRTPRVELEALLSEVDAALARLDDGTFGICEVCHENIEADRLARDPLSRCCSDHVTPAEQMRLQRDLALAREVQLGLLPAPNCALDGWHYHYRYEAAGEVGGDFCDVIPSSTGRETLVLVGDVSGKGIAASMLMTSLIATVRSLSSLGLPTPEFLTRVNDLFHDSAARSAYATLSVAALQPDGGVDLYSAGHWAPLLRRGRTIERPTVEPGLPLGLFPASSYAPTRLQLDRGDTLLFYTDGVIDAENSNGDDYNAARLAQAFAAADEAALDHVVDRCLSDVQTFKNGRAGDDLMLLALART